MMVGRGLLATALVVAMTTAVMAKHNTPTLRDQEQAACAHDATTLCKDAVPDEAKIEACMRAKMSQVSAGCRKFFKK